MVHATRNASAVSAAIIPVALRKIRAIERLR
jgi:hypothetical protein